MEENLNTHEIQEHPETIQNTKTNPEQEMEHAVAEKSIANKEKHIVAMLDYSVMSLDQLNESLRNLLDKEPIQLIKPNIDAIKVNFLAKYNELFENKKADFLATTVEEGEEPLTEKDFHFNSEEKKEFDGLVRSYRNQRDQYYTSQELERKENLIKRESIIEELKVVIEKADPNSMYNEYKSLNDRWKLVGAVPTDHYNNVWKTYHHHVERFYDLLHLNKEFRELDFKYNLDEKLKIIAKAEALAEAPDVNIAFKELQDLHLIWKEEIGPVTRERRDEIWERFSAATKKLHDRRHEYFKEQRAKVQLLIDAKKSVITEINNYDCSKNKSHNDWQKSIADIEALRQKYFDLGKLPFSKSETLWQEFKQATKRFNAAKNSYYRDEKKVQNENLSKKLKMVELAENLKDSENWKEATETLKQLQADWKKVGHVPRKFSESIWKQFKTACNHYFDRLNQRNEVENKEQNAILVKKKAFLDVFKTKETITLTEVKEAIQQWQEIGSLPRNARFLDGKFYKAVDIILEKQNMSRGDVEMIKFKNVVDNYLAQKDFRKLDSEQLFVRRKIDEIFKEIQQLENNLSFISNPSKDNPFVLNVQKGIEKSKSTLDLWKSKLKYLKDLNY